MNDVTQIINRISAGDPEASERPFPLVYQELRALAGGRMSRERNDHTLSPTALVHEAYLRLVGPEDSNSWSGRRHFFAAASEAMRRILIDHARSKNAAKRGGQLKKQEFVESWIIDSASPNELLEMDEALTQLESEDAEAATLVKLRFFAGMTNRQAAETLECSPRKADMLWSYARSWLKRYLTKDDT